MNGPHIQFFDTLTRDPEQCYSKDDGIPYARLRVAVRTRYDDDQPPDTDDFEVYLWSHHTDTAVAHCRKGQQVYVFGRFPGRERHRADDTQGLAHLVNARMLSHSSTARLLVKIKLETRWRLRMSS